MATEIPQDKLLEILHKVTYGRQDDFFAKHDMTPPTYERVLRHVSATVDSTSPYMAMLGGQTGYIRRIKIENPTLNTEGIANLRILGDKWTIAELTAGYQYLSRIYRFMGCNSFPMLDDGLYIPFVERHTLELQICGDTTSFDIEYDIVEVSKKDNYQYSYTNLQYPGSETLTTDLSKVRLCLNHPVVRLTAKFDKPVESVELNAIPSSEHPPCVPFQKVSETEFVAEFGKNSINFSRLDAPILLINNSSDDNKLYYYAHTKEVIRIFDGMYGLLFRK